ncbi:hypothetical protein REPUB_Repub06bG0170700 [Reevesia pubescens]
MKKAYWITCNVEPDIQHLSLDRRRFPSNLVVRPRDLNRYLANFQSSLQEITIIATEPTFLPSDAASKISGKIVELRSYINPTKVNDSSLHTQLWIDPMEEFVQYTHTGDPVDVTFSVKKLKAARQLEFFKGISDSRPNTDSLADALAIAQHHDAVTGTEKQHVANDYAKRLSIGYIEAEKVVASSLACLADSKSSIGCGCGDSTTIFQQANITRTNHTMWTMGTDFRSEMWDSFDREPSSNLGLKSGSVLENLGAQPTKAKEIIKQVV